MPPQYGEFFSPLTTNSWEQLPSLGHPSKFQRFWRLRFVTAATSLIGGQPNLARCLAISWSGTLYIHFRGLLPLMEFCQVQNSLCVSKSFQVLRSHILAALLHGTPAAGVNQTAAWYKEWNYGTSAEGVTYCILTIKNVLSLSNVV